MYKLLKIVFIMIGILLICVSLLAFVNKVLPSSSRLKFAQALFSRDRKIHSGVVAVSSGDGQIDYQMGKEMDQESMFYAASISKLFTHALIYQLVDEGKLALDQTFRYYLPEDKYSQLLVVDGVDYTDQITIQQLLDQTSGLGDYETDPLADGSIIMDQLKLEDFPLTVDQALDLTRQLDTARIPNQRAFYSNLNALILGVIAEELRGQNLEKLYHEYICQPLGLAVTQVANEELMPTPVNIDDRQVDPCQYCLSAPAAGGIVTNNRELMRFLQAFMQGQLFDASHLRHPEFRSLQFYPIRYGSGMMSCQMSFWMAPVIPAPQIIGHSGSTGSFAFYCPNKDLYITGTINQTEKNPFSNLYLFLNGFDA